KGKLRGHGVWTPGQVYPILKRETYRGIWYAYRYKSENGKRVRRPREEWVGVPVPAIIDNETWKLAKKKMKEGRALSKRNNSSHQYLMGRLLSCTCGYRVQGKPSWTRHKTVYLYYRCNGKDRSITARRCDLPAFKAEEVDTAVWDWIEKILSRPGFIRQSLLEAQEASEKFNQSLYNRLQTVEELIAQNQDKLNRLLDLYLTGDFDREMLVEKQNQIQQIISDLERERGDILINLEESVITDEQIINIEAVAQEIRSKLNGKKDFDSKRKVLEMMNVSGTLAFEDGEKVIYVQCVLGRDRLSVNSATR
ncbi:MAG: recombinase family protein, partial [Anaerolineales bacterium]|nr:recombinase family protein [Anaerolineales bacterium]